MTERGLSLDRAGYASELDGVFGSSRTPFYIYAPPLIEASAGVRLMYQLCHMVNAQGGQAWMLPDGTASDGRSHSLTYTAPLLTESVARAHFRLGSTPVTVYSETVHGNPLQAPVVARWFLNSPGLLGGPPRQAKSEVTFAFTDNIAKGLDGADRLYLPTTDIREIDEVPMTPWHKRSRSAPVLIYAAKYKQFVGAPRETRLFPDRIRIHLERAGPNRQSRPGLLQLLSSAHCLIAYENTAVITEAVLLGTPVILHKSPFFEYLIGESESGSAGTAWSSDDDPLESALATLPQARDDYLQSVKRSRDDVANFMTKMRGVAQLRDYESLVGFSSQGNRTRVTWRDRLAYGRRVYGERGAAALTAATLDFAARKISTRVEGA
jgi:hypothetical protein